MKMKTDTSQVLMSDTLKGHIPLLEGEAIADTVDKHVIVVIERAPGSTPLVGVLRGVLLGPPSEIEFRCDLNDALDVIEGKGQPFGKIQLHCGERVVEVDGPFETKATRLDEISPDDRLCTLGLHLVQRTARADI